MGIISNDVYRIEELTALLTSGQSLKVHVNEHEIQSKQGAA